MGETPRKAKHPRTCPLCGLVFERLYSHMKDEHAESDGDMLAFHLVKALRRLGAQ